VQRLEIEVAVLVDREQKQTPFLVLKQQVFREGPGYVAAKALPFIDGRVCGIGNRQCGYAERGEALAETRAGVVAFGFRAILHRQLGGVRIHSLGMGLGCEVLRSYHSKD
jgi:hypothetical protein